LGRDEITRVGLLGAGRMGGPIGRHLLAAGTPVTVFDPSPKACEALVALGARQAERASDAAAGAGVVLVVVVDDDQVRDAVSAALQSAAPGTVIAVCASVRPDTVRDLARAVAARDVDIVDAALVRGERGAEAGQLVLYCGGPAEAIDRLREASAPFAEAVVRVGDVGAGQVAKTANNILLWACLRADVEAQRLARALGVAPRELREALALGSGANRPLAEWGAHRLRWPAKDLEVALAVAAEAGVDMPLVAELPRLMAELTPEDLRELL
jgi:3-hydroxyisobutyrate dehydrogenase-like beta-hydroxyacid dehydrogenase